MEAVKIAALLAGAMLLIGSAARAEDFDWDDIFAPYLQRIDPATTSSGNAQNVNAATQVITPWPPYVHNRRIPGDGVHGVKAVEGYHTRPLSSATATTSQNAAPPAQGESAGTSNGAGDPAQAGKSAQ